MPLLVLATGGLRESSGAATPSPCDATLLVTADDPFRYQQHEGPSRCEGRYETPRSGQVVLVSAHWMAGGVTTDRTLPASSRIRLSWSGAPSDPEAKTVQVTSLRSDVRYRLDAAAQANVFEWPAQVVGSLKLRADEIGYLVRAHTTGGQPLHIVPVTVDVVEGSPTQAVPARAPLKLVFLPRMQLRSLAVEVVPPKAGGKTVFLRSGAATFLPASHPVPVTVDLPSGGLHIRATAESASGAFSAQDYWLGGPGTAGP